MGAVFSQLLGLLERLGVAEVEEVVDAIGVDPDRPVRGHEPLAGTIGDGAVDFGDVPLGLLPVLLLLLRGLRPRPRRLGLRVVGHVRKGEGEGDVEGVQKLPKGKGERSASDLRDSTELKETAGGGTCTFRARSSVSLGGGSGGDAAAPDVTLWAQVRPCRRSSVVPFFFPRGQITAVTVHHGGARTSSCASQIIYEK